MPVNSLVIIWVASFTICTPQTLETRGTVRDALGLASSTYTLPSSMAYCMFIRPQTPISSAILRVYSLMVATNSSGIFLEGRIHAESPECTPASSICSITAGT